MTVKIDSGSRCNLVTAGRSSQGGMYSGRRVGEDAPLRACGGRAHQTNPRDAPEPLVGRQACSAEIGTSRRSCLFFAGRDRPSPYFVAAGTVFTL